MTLDRIRLCCFSFSLFSFSFSTHETQDRKIRSGLRSLYRNTVNSNSDIAETLFSDENVHICSHWGATKFSKFEGRFSHFNA